MKQRFYIFICLVLIIALAPYCSAETNPSSAMKTSIETKSSETVAATKTVPESVSNSKKNFHLEVGGNYNWLTNGYGTWKALDMRLMYSGFDRITPFASISTQSRNEGSQRVYGVGSYISINPKFYMIAGVSGAPVRDPNVILYPRLRMDIVGILKAPIVDGLMLTAGVTHFPMQNGGGGDSISIGGIYYIGKAVFSGSLNYNIARPGSVTSLSGQIGFMYGTEGKYWLGGGIATGRVAYQLASTIPFDVRYESRGVNIFYKHWIGKNWGVNSRLDYQNLVGAYKLNGITLSLFVDF